VRFVEFLQQRVRITTLQCFRDQFPKHSRSLEREDATVVLWREGCVADAKT
jgi:hypothetical protein